APCRRLFDWVESKPHSSRDWQAELPVVRQGAAVIFGKKLPEESGTHNVVANLQPLGNSRITIVQWSLVALRMAFIKDQASQSVWKQTNLRKHFIAIDSEAGPRRAH
ncbi:MAG: hypothetical protein ACRESZ_10440, partial [Methylococcales bacterium]